MRYTPAAGYSLMAVAVLCFFLGAPPWMFLATGLSAVVFGYVGLRQGQAERDAAAEAESESDAMGGQD